MTARTYAVLLGVPHSGGNAWRWAAAEFDARFADQVSPPVPSADLVSEVRRGRDGLRLRIAITVQAADVADAVTAAWAVLASATVQARPSPLALGSLPRAVRGANDAELGRGPPDRKILVRGRSHLARFHLLPRGLCSTFEPGGERRREVTARGHPRSVAADMPVVREGQSRHQGGCVLVGAAGKPKCRCPAPGVLLPGGAAVASDFAAAAEAQACSPPPGRAAAVAAWRAVSGGIDGAFRDSGRCGLRRVLSR
jgi:hypothetical protein